MPPDGYTIVTLNDGTLEKLTEIMNAKATLKRLNSPSMRRWLGRPLSLSLNSFSKHLNEFSNYRNYYGKSPLRFVYSHSAISTPYLLAIRPRMTHRYYYQY
jgi:hypothetical protein